MRWVLKLGVGLKLGLVGYQVIKKQIIEGIEGMCIVYTLMDVSFIH